MLTNNCLVFGIACLFFCAPTTCKEERKKQQIDDSIGYSEKKNKVLSANLYTIEAQ